MPANPRPLQAGVSRQLLKLAGTTAEAGEGDPGTVVSASPEGVRIACGEGVLRVRELQLPGRKRLSAAEFLRGHLLAPGTRMESGK